MKNWDETIKEYESKGVTNMSAIIALDQAGNREVTEIKEMIRIRQGDIIKDLLDGSSNITQSKQSVMDTKRAILNDEFINLLNDRLIKIESTKTLVNIAIKI